MYDRLIALSVKRELSLAEADEVGELFIKVCDAEKSREREDCLFIIKNRLWHMPIAALEA